MSAQPAFGRRGLLATALARAEAWLLDPPDEAAETAVELRPRPVVAVFGLAESCGATVTARALAAELAERDPGGAAAVAGAARAAALPLGSGPANRLARMLAPLSAALVQPVGRLCLVDAGDPGRLADAFRYLAPLVIDAGRTEIGGVAAALADHVVLVAAPFTEPALAAVARASLGREGSRPLVAVNRARGATPVGWADVSLPESRMGAQFALAGRGARAELGRAVAQLADLCEEARA